MALKILAAALAVALAFTLNGVLLHVIDHIPESLVPTGVYYGWIDASGAAGRFQVPGDACIDAVGDGHRLIEAALSNRSVTAVLVPPAVDLVPEAFSFDLAVPVYSFHPTALAALAPLASEDPTGRHTVEFDQLVVRCRDHSETSAHLGSAALRVIEESVAGDLLATSRPVPPTLHALGILVISNDGAETVTLTSLDYAPAASATGTVRAASGDRRYVPLWLGEAYSAPRTQTSATTGNPLTGQPPAGRDSGPPATRPLIGAVDPAELTPWDAAYLDPADARNLRDHDADRLDLVMRPGEVAVIVVDHRALVRTLLPRPALLYPVLGYVVGTGCERAARRGTAAHGDPAVRADQCSRAGAAAHTTAMGLDAALYGLTPAWR